MDQSSVWDLSTLAQVGRAIAAAAHDPQELAEVAFLETARLVSTDFFQLGLFQGEVYRTLIWVRDGNRVDNLSFSLDTENENIIGWVRRSGEPLLVRNFEEEINQLPARPGYDAADPPVSGLFLPLRVANSTVGLLALQSRKPDAFSENHLQLLSIISHSLAASLAHMTYRQEAEFLALHMVLVQEVSRLLMSLDPLDERLHQVVTLMAEVLNYAGVDVYELLDDKLSLHTSSLTQSSGETDGGIPEIVQRCADRSSVQVSSRGDGSLGGETSPLWESAFPLQVVDHVLGVVQIRSWNEVDIEGEQGNILAMVANQLGFAMLEARNYDERQEEAWMTTVLLEVAKHAAQPGDTMVALQAVLQLATLLAGTDWALLLLPEDTNDQLRIGLSAGFRRQETLPFETLRINIRDFKLEPPFDESEDPTSIELPQGLAELLSQSHALCLKLSDGANLMGLLLMEGGPLPGIRPALLAGIGHQVSLRLENARLVEEAAVRQSLERELMMARTIQASFLPGELPAIEGWEVAAAWESAREVGGDFYDFIPLPSTDESERWGIVIADVADKGIPAALYMALCRTMLRSVAQTHILPGRTLEIVNQQLISDTRADLFVSIFYAVWEPSLARLTYANAGHLPPLLFTKGKRAKLIREHGIVLGVIPDAQFSDQVLELAPGDLFVLYTDGVSEAFNHDQELFGLQRLESLILSLDDWNAATIAAAIVDRIVEYKGGRDFSDDLTTVTMRRMP